MAASLVGKYTFDKHENLVEFYKSINVPEAFVDKLIPASGSTKEFVIDGNKIIMTGGYSATFVLDTEVEETNQHNYTMKSISKMDGNKLVVSSTTPENHNTTLTRVYETNNKGLMITMTSDKTPVVAKYFYKRT